MAHSCDTKPFCAFEWMLAWRYLRARRKEGFISVIAAFSLTGITLGVATLIIVMAVMNGFRSELLNKILGFSGHLTVYPMDGKPIENWQELAQKLMTIEGVKSAVPYVEGQVMASSDRQATGALVRGIRLDDLKKLPGINNEKLRGDWQDFDDGEGIVVGYRFAWKHGLVLGDSVTLISPRGPETPFGSAPRLRGFTISAIFEVGMSEYDENVVYMPFGLAQDFFMVEGGASAVEVMVDKPDVVEVQAAKVAEMMNGQAQIVTWKRANQSFFSALAVERNVMFIILTLIVLVAALNIISGLIMLVKDKGHDIAILRTMGASRGAVQRVFLITGSAIGVAGTIVGSLLGVLVCLNIESIRQLVSKLTNTEVFSPEIYYLTKLPADMDSFETGSIILMALFLSFIATLYPSWRAAKLDPVEALRYE